MAIDLNTYNTGDTDYITKFNADFSEIQAAINSLLAAQAVPGEGSESASTTQFFSAFFGGVTGLVGVGSYEPTQGGTTLTFAAGTAYLSSSNTVVSKLTSTGINWVGQPSDTYYVSIDSAGTPQRSDTAGVDDIYTVVWNGSAFVSVTRTAPAVATSVELDAARRSAELGDFDSLDERLEAAEAAIETVADAVGITTRMRKFGMTIDGQGEVITTGDKGMDQVDYAGVIKGWVAIADQEGSIEIEVSVARNSPPEVPPGEPPIPNTSTDKISASAPIEIGGMSPPTTQSQSGGVIEVATWDTTILAWDVIRFKVASVSDITWVQVWIWIEETL